MQRLTLTREQWLAALTKPRPDLPVTYDLDSAAGHHLIVIAVRCRGLSP